MWLEVSLAPPGGGDWAPCVESQSSKRVCDVVSSLPGLHWLLVMVSAIAPPSPVSSARLLGIIVYFELSNSSL